MNVYDFDNTIYCGESTLDFYFFCVKHHPQLMKFVFVVVWSLVKYKLCLISEDGLMRLCTDYVQDFLRICPDAEDLAEEFWKINICKVKSFYMDMHREDDVVISASFGFTLRPVMKHLGVKNLVCSEVNLETGEIERLCFRKNKKTLFFENFGERIENFYTDSLNDEEMLKIADNGFIVKGDRVEKWSGK